MEKMQTRTNFERELKAAGDPNRATLLGWPALARIHMPDLTDGLASHCPVLRISVYNDIGKTFLAGAGQLYAAGIYSAAYRIIDVASVPIYVVYTAATPRFFREGERSVADGSALADGLLRRTVPYGILMALLMFVVSPLLPHIFGSSFGGSAEALRWLCPLPLIRCLHYAWGTTITGSSSQWYRTATQLGATGANLLLNVALIPRWSWRGAAVASLLTDAGARRGLLDGCAIPAHERRCCQSGHTDCMTA